MGNGDWWWWGWWGVYVGVGGRLGERSNSLNQHPFGGSNHHAVFSERLRHESHMESSETGDYSMSPTGALLYPCRHITSIQIDTRLDEQRRVGYILTLVGKYLTSFHRAQ